MAVVPFNNTAVWALIRFLVNDPAADSITNADLSSKFVTPAYRDWWFRFERRPRRSMFGNLELTAGSRNVTLTSSAVPAVDLIEAITLEGYTDGLSSLIPFSPNVNHDMTKTTLNAVQYLQESEGATGEPRLVAIEPNVSVDTLTLWLYPIANDGNDPPNTAGYMVGFYGRGVAGALGSGGTTTMQLDPISARYIARIAAFNLARSLDLPLRKRTACIAGLPKWVKVHFDFDRLMHAGSLPDEDVPLWRPEWPER